MLPLRRARSYFRFFYALFFCAQIRLATVKVLAGDAAQLISMTLASNTVVMPRTTFTQTWTFLNTGSTTWTPTRNGYTLNLVGTECLGAIPISTNTLPSAYEPVADIDSGLSIPPGAQAAYTMTFIAPEVPGTYTNTFQLNSASSVFFGPMAAVQVVVPLAGSTNQYDRARAVSYANNYVKVVCSDGYFWTNGSGYSNYGVGALVPTNLTGDDCAHFVSCCIGNQAAQRGGGLNIISRVPPTYGEPGAQRLIYTNLIAGGYAEEVYSLSQMEPGDVIGWNWEGNTNTADIDHVTLYLGNGLIAAHANSHLDVSIAYYQSSEPGCVFHLIHLFDAPTIASSRIGTNLIMKWGTNWTGYSLYSSTSMTPGATWSKVSKSPVTSGSQKVLTNAIPATGSLFYRLSMP